MAGKKGASFSVMVTEVETWKEGEFCLRDAWGKDCGLNGTLVVLPPPWRGFYVQLNRETFRVRTFLPNIITDNWVFFLNFLLFFYTISPFLALRQPAMFSERLSPLRLWGLVKLCLAPSFLASRPTTSPLPSTQLTALRPENQDDKSQRSHPFKP